MTQSTCPFGAGFDFTDPDVLLRGIPVTEFAELRKTAPVWWNEQPESIFGDGGYWVISRHEDIKAVSRDSDLWSTNRKGVVMRLPDGTTPDQLELTKALLINHDAPEHTRLRKLVARLVTARERSPSARRSAPCRPRNRCHAKEKGTRRLRRRHRDEPAAAGHRRPVGVPETDGRSCSDWTNAIMNTDDPDFETDYTAANAELMDYAYNMAEERSRASGWCPRPTRRHRHPADRGGHRRRSARRRRVRVLRNPARGRGQRDDPQRDDARHERVLREPDQWELYKRERPATAADEIVRWATPVHCFQRTALADTELGGVTIREGQRAGLFYSSANYDEAVFDRPFQFDISRDPNPHLGFGGNGAHYCIGANLARMEIKLIFNEIADQMPNIAKLAEPQRLRRGGSTGSRSCKSPIEADVASRRAYPWMVGIGAGSDDEAVERILAAASKAIDERGADISIADVARTLGVTRQTVTGISPARSCWWRQRSRGDVPRGGAGTERGRRGGHRHGAGVVAEGQAHRPADRARPGHGAHRMGDLRPRCAVCELHAAAV